MKTTLKLLCATILVIAGTLTTNAAEKQTVVISHYTGWEPWLYADSSGILEKNNKKFGTKIEIQLINDYLESISRYTADKTVIGLTVTQMDALIGPCVGGVDSTVLIVGDYSNGNDAVVAKGAESIKDIKGRNVMLAVDSVSHYLLYRALDKAEIKISDVQTTNVSDADVAALFSAAGNDAVCATWNPPLMTVRQVKGAKVLFDSSQIPGEILDLLIVRTDTPDNVKKALVATWYETMDVIYGSGPKANEAIEFMAQSAGCTKAEFETQLKTTYMFDKPEAALKFTNDPALKKSLDYTRTFCFDRGLYQGASTKDFVGIEFPDKSILGSNRNIKLRFDSSYVEKYAKGE